MEELQGEACWGVAVSAVGIGKVSPLEVPEMETRAPEYRLNRREPVFDAVVLDERKICDHSNGGRWVLMNYFNMRVWDMPRGRDAARRMMVRMKTPKSQGSSAIGESTKRRVVASERTDQLETTTGN